MDDRIHNDFEREKRPPSSGGADNVGKRSRAGDFKVSINYDGFDAYEKNARTGSSYPGSQRPRPAQNEKFRVSIPGQNPAQSRAPQRPQSSAAPRSASGRTSQPRQTSASGRNPSATGRTSSTNRAPSRSTSSASRKPAARRQPTKEQIKKAEKARAKRLKQAEKAERKSAKKSKQKMTPEQAAKQRVEKRYKTTKSLLILCVSLIFITIITTTLSTLALTTINDILAIRKESGTAVSVYIPEKATFDDVFNAISDSGLINQKFFCKLFCKFRHYDKYYDSKKKEYVAVKYEPGVYYFETGDGLEAMLESIKSAKANSRETVRLTFPEGWTVAQIFAKIEKYNVCTAEKLYANLDIVGKQFKFYENIKSNSGRYLKAEGYLFPDTYEFYIGESASSVLKKLFGNFESKWTSEYSQKAKELGLSKDEVMIIASIIQREAKDKSQMADISSVIHNRLADSATYPLLEMNSTKDYISATKEFDVFTDFYYTLYLNSYNTYSEEGLPPGAICNPGMDAIEATLNPNDTTYYYFCHDNMGTMYLASTAAEHQVNTEKILYETN